jgi:hypothetical protein
LGKKLSGGRVAQKACHAVQVEWVQQNFLLARAAIAAKGALKTE